MPTDMLKAQLVKLKKSKDKNVQNKINLIEEILQMEIAYMEQPRGYGQGFRRIGNTLEVSEDIFALTFIAMLDDELIHNHFDIVNGKVWEEDSPEREKLLNALKLN